MFGKKKSHDCKMEFVKDENGDEVLLKDGKYQVMMEWEKPYMNAIIEELKPKGDVLEIGFGCGYSADYIQSYKPKSHTIVECHPEVLKKAKAWAKDKKNVTIVENTWQDALKKLGKYDTIFFDDYPLGSPDSTKSYLGMKNVGNMILEQGQKIMSKLQLKMQFLKDLNYSDEDIEYFFTHLKNKEQVDPHHYLPFFYELKENGNITDKQYDMMVKRLRDEKIINDTIEKEFAEKLKNEPIETEFNFNENQDRFFDFLELCLKDHTNQGARISCYLDNPVSKYQDEKFLNHIITNPNLEYYEKEMSVDVPKSCSYYPFDKALVMVIEKMI